MLMTQRFLALLVVSVALLAASWPSSAGAHRTFGVYIDPSQLDGWSTTVGARPHVLAAFEAFSRSRTLDDWLAQVEQQHISRVLITWEPWAPVPTSLGVAQQSVPQPPIGNSPPEPPAFLRSSLAVNRKISAHQ